VPHLTLEFTANLAEPVSLAGLLHELHGLITDAAGVQSKNLKSRAIRRDIFAIGQGERDEGFVHLEIALFCGRPPAIKEQIGRQSLALLERRFAPREDGPAVQITVEIRDIDRAGYFKSS
jgi:5-carboxymethyl-2-hydroxymuconate isomerase